ncbi:unnamed protein product [Ambrosiozyma monospora]|uniref:Unnamed protein product n=1 Tax=Ambrosiozyma monospora TaxID=43982 RepID=A0A9W6YZP7_AMBMO|nr:unnamed protein product [Ambrosiozyma monospora]
MTDHQEQLSNTDTAVGAPPVSEEKGSPVSDDPVYEDDGSVILPPRTGLLRTSWYKRTGSWRPFPASCSAGLAVLATTLFLIGLVFCRAHSVKNPVVLTGTLFFASGLIQIIAGIWAIVDNNLFGSTLLLSYAAYFMTYGAIISKPFEVDGSYTQDAYDDALGLVYAAWTVLDFCLWTATFKSTVPLFLLTFFKWFYMLLYTIAVFGGHTGVETAAGCC